MRDSVPHTLSTLPDHLRCDDQISNCRKVTTCIDILKRKQLRDHQNRLTRESKTTKTCFFSFLVLPASSVAPRAM